jgi:hypothetical protein
MVGCTGAYLLERKLDRHFEYLCPNLRCFASTRKSDADLSARAEWCDRPIARLDCRAFANLLDCGSLDDDQQ